MIYTYVKKFVWKRGENKQVQFLIKIKLKQKYKLNSLNLRNWSQQIASKLWKRMEKILKCSQFF